MTSPRTPARRNGLAPEDIRYVQLLKEFNRRGLVADSGLPVGASLAQQNAALDILQVPQNIIEAIAGLGVSALHGPTKERARQLRAEGVPSSLASTQAYRETDLPSARIPVTPGAFIEAISPGTPDILTGKGRGLSRADVGVKGLIEELVAPENLLLGLAPAAKGLWRLGKLGGRTVAAAKQAPEVATRLLQLGQAMPAGGRQPPPPPVRGRRYAERGPVGGGANGGPDVGGLTEFPSGLGAPKPKYINHELSFASDVDTALYIITKGRAVQSDKKFVKWLTETLGTTEQALKAEGLILRQQIKDLLNTHD